MRVKAADVTGAVILIIVLAVSIVGWSTIHGGENTPVINDGPPTHVHGKYRRGRRE